MHVVLTYLSSINDQDTCMYQHGSVVQLFAMFARGARHEYYIHTLYIMYILYAYIQLYTYLAGRPQYQKPARQQLRSVVQLFAMFARGARSEIYFSIIREIVDYRRIFARFALRCLASAYIYEHMDDDSSRRIDASEMHHVLKGIFQHHLDADELVALTDFVMTTVGEQGGDMENHPQPFSRGSKALVRTHMHKNCWFRY